LKKFIALTLVLMMIFTLSACSNGESRQPDTEPSANSEPIEPEETDESVPKTDDTGETAVPSSDDGSNILIAYFTNPEPGGVDAMSQASRVVVGGEVSGNTQFIAQIIQRETGGSMFAIETIQEYPARPDLTDMAENERNQNARPELSARIENFQDYDVIFLGYPNWWADMPMPLYTFLEQYDFSGKTIIPFTTHAGSGFSDTIQTIAYLQPNATVIPDGLAVSRGSVPNSEDDVLAWVRGLDVATQ